MSQNADRFHNNIGLVSCITPKGQLFCTIRQRPPNGIELLVLQGLPSNKIHLASESPSECQDLAGNAMTTSVIAASLISAITSSWQLFRTPSLSQGESNAEELSAPLINQFMRSGRLVNYSLNVSDPEDVDINVFSRGAYLSSRLCSCERNNELCKAPVQICSACGHTACASHAGNPKHAYKDFLHREYRLQTPGEFVSEWRPRLPPRVSFDNFSAFSFSECYRNQLAVDERTTEFADRLDEAEIESQPFYMGQFIRHDRAWKVQYQSAQAVLDLLIGEEPRWLLFVRCPSDLPGDSELRKLFEKPIARGVITDSLLSPKWEIFIPFARDVSLRISGSPEVSKSFRNEMGLIEFQAETVPARLHLRSNNLDISDWVWAQDDITGDYDHLPHCGTACQSLYKRSTKPPLYLFLDPDYRNHGIDSFIFSHDCARRHPLEPRQSIARLSSSWRPWNLSDTNSCTNAIYTGSWEKQRLGPWS